MLIISSFPHTHRHMQSVNALEVRRLGEGAVQHLLINADTNRKLILFFVRWVIRGRQTSDECKIYIHTQALLQPKRCTDHSLHTKFHLQSQTGMQNTQTCTHTRNARILYPAGVNSQCDCFVLCHAMLLLLNRCTCGCTCTHIYLFFFFRTEHLNWIISSYVFRDKCTVHNAVSHELLET